MNKQFDALRRQFVKNAESMAEMLAKAESIGRKVGGFSADELRAKLADYRRFSAYSDAEMSAHLVESRSRMSARLSAIRAGGK